MGLFKRRYKDPVAGTARVVSATAAPPHTKYAQCRMQLVVEGPGVPAYSQVLTGRLVPIAKWPQPGVVLPVEIDRSDTERVRILWDDVPTGAERSAASARTIAEGLRGGPSSPQAKPGVPPEVVASDADADPVERLEKLVKLRDMGVVDAEQFDLLKAQILGQSGR